MDDCLGSHSCFAFQLLGYLKEEHMGTWPKGGLILVMGILP